MRELVKITPTTINNQEINTVNARELHAFLEVETRFNDWIERRIKEYGFVENQDFTTLTQNRVNGGRLKEYHATLDMAKELSMVERNEKGKQARQYFLDCERKAKAKNDPSVMLEDPAALRAILLTYTEKVEALEEKNKVLTPKADALDRISYAEGSRCITDTAKELQIRPKDLFSMLSKNRWIYRRLGRKGWVAYQDRIQQGVLTHKVTTIEDAHTGEERVVEQVRVTPKGLAKLAAMLEEVSA